MIRSLKKLLCILLSSATVASCCACTSTGNSQTTTSGSENAEVQTTQSLSTDDESATEPATYNYVMIKQKSDNIISKLDQIIADKKYKGTTYLKIGNDFEYINSSGYADKAAHTDNSINTCYYTGSITKQLTSAAIMQLYEQEKLSLDDTIEKYFPKYEYAEKITIKNLLTMTSGIKNYMNRDNETDSFIYVQNEIDKKIKQDNSAKENKEIILNWIFSQELMFEPDSQFRYSDSNYYLLGEIIEKASGVPYEEYVTENILKPLGMTSSGFEATELLAKNYEGKDDKNSTLYNGVAYSSLGFISNVSDLLKWVDGLLDGMVVSYPSLREMFTAYKENYGYGFNVNGYKLSQTGSTEEYNSMLAFTRDKSEIYISLTNYAYSDPVYIYSLFKKTLSRYYG